MVENINRWIRQFIFKGSDLSKYDIEYIKWIEEWFSHLPRVCLDGRTAYETMTSKEFGKAIRSLEINLPKLRIRG